MIEVSHLTKKFGDIIAVNDVSFSVARGEIVGFLGPNGAGKTTTMRMLAAYFPPSGGHVKVAGRDIFDNSLEVRRRIGYLPESCPLYPEMRVDEYLSFRAALKGVVRRDRHRRVERVKKQCGLGSVGRSIIGQLSKGYRQRVGLADALVHEPELLILDEPTIGLDPRQIRQVRSLIRELSQRHTILLSTHILPEVEMTCQRVLIINEGRIVASDTPDNLRTLMGGGWRIIAELHGPRAEVAEEFSAFPAVHRVIVSELSENWLRLELEVKRGMDLRANIFETCARRGWRLRQLGFEEYSLEEIFVELTHDEPGEGRITP